MKDYLNYGIDDCDRGEGPEIMAVRDRDGELRYFRVSHEHVLRFSSEEIDEETAMREAKS